MRRSMRPHRGNRDPRPSRHSRIAGASPPWPPGRRLGQSPSSPVRDDLRRACRRGAGYGGVQMIAPAVDTHRWAGASLGTGVTAAAGRPAWICADLDNTAPAPARVINALLGGFHHFRVDRDLADRAQEVWNGLNLLAW